MPEQQKRSTKLVSLAQAAKLSPYSADYLNLLVRRGKLPAKKLGRNWYTSEAAVQWYLRRRHVPTRAGERFAEQNQVLPYAEDPRAAGESFAQHPGSGVDPIMIGYTRKQHAIAATTALRWLLLALAIFLLLLFLFPDLVFGMSSPSYRIDQSFVGGGGTRESSPNYQVQETVGDIGTGNSQSANYRLRAGYLPGTQDASLIFTVSTTSLNLGTITPSSVSTAVHTMTVVTDLTRGYVITAQADGSFRSGANTIPFVADGLVTAGSTEYGAAFTGGLGSHPAGDIGLASLTTVTSYNDNVSAGDTTTATYKTSASPVTRAGSYASTTTYIATGTF